jgi:hypothetical protein
MNSDQQIEEMAKVIDQAKYDMWVGKAHQSGDFTNHSKNIAKALYAKGYRKASEVIDEFEKIVLAGIEKDESFREKMHTDTDRSYFEGGANSQRKLLWFIRELKKKYTKEITEEGK